ncbi:putative RNA-directed DNA polymerase, eukaryota, reverse transcriptase zinc-binding domain protein [Tanacetum coccineum]
MVLTNTPFNGSNFHGWSRNVKMALGAKLKLGFIDGSCLKPDVGDAELQRCDYMVTCLILNSMVTELSDAFLYAHSACELWKEIAERYGQSNGPLVYQLERELCKISQGQSSGRKDTRGNINDGKRYCTGCNQERHTVDQCFEKIGYPNWYKGKKAKTQGRIVAHVNSGFDKYFSRDSPFDMRNENEVAMNQNGGFDQKLVVVVCQEMIKMFKGKGIVSEGHFTCRSKTVTIVGSVQLTPTLILTNVFYVPEFQLNLLSIGHLI